ncbi:MAG: dTDP-glucose 4,6-dehydratase [Pseudonocardiaceae bacterium]
MRMLVTGGAGFIGSNFVHYTRQHHPEYEITVIDSLTYAGSDDSLRAVASDISFVTQDIRDAGTVNKVVADADVVVHFAAESHVDNSLSDPGIFVETNLVGTFNLLEAVRRHDCRFHHISTDEVFGDLPVDSVEKFTEETRYNPSSPYSATKAGSDMLVRAWARSYGVAATISNCANNYGPYQHVEKLIPRQVTNLLTGRRVKLYGAGENVREWTHVDDHNAAVHAILRGGDAGETYLIGSGDERSNLDIVQTVLRIMGFDENDFDHVSDRPGHDLRYSNDSSKIRERLGWRPIHTDIRHGLEATIDWYRENRWWWQSKKESTEQKYAIVGR